MSAQILHTIRDREIMGNIVRLAWPSVAEQALQTMVQYADTAQVGHISADASAAVGLTATTMWLVQAPLWALAMGVLAAISQALGARDEQRARRVAGQAVLLTLISGFLLTVLTLAVSAPLPRWLGADPDIRRDAFLYFAIVCAPMLFRASSIIFAAALRGTGNSKTPMKINILMNGMNIFLNFVLINPSQTLHVWGLSIPFWGAGLGVAGAALATAASYVAGGSLMFLKFYRSPELKLRGVPVRYDRPAMRQCLRISIPIAAERVTASLGQVVFTALIAKLGTLAVAAHSIAITAEQAFYVPGYGMQSAAATLAGYSVGAGDEKKLGQYSSAIMAIAVCLMGLMSCALFLFPGLFMSFFTPDQAVIALGASVLRIVSVSEPFFAVVIILEGTFNGAGDTRVPFLISLFSMWGIRIVCTYVCIHFFHLGLTAVWWCMVGDNMARFILLTLRYRGSRWKRLRPVQP